MTASIFLAVFPLVHWAIAQSIDRDPLDPRMERGPLTLALSPAAAILSALEPATRHRTFPLYSGEVPVPAAFGLLYLAAGTVFLWIAQRRMGRLRRALPGGAPCR